jgi:beta-lactamase regulating signal transducer with metallopeptidase domain/thiol-disulfide isomerase/thioredoxin
MSPTTGLMLTDFAVKSALVLGITAIAAYCLRSKSAATVHRVWTLGFAALLAAPAAGLLLPQRGVEVVPRISASSPPVVVVTGDDAQRAPTYTTATIPTAPLPQAALSPSDASVKEAAPISVEGDHESAVIPSPSTDEKSVRSPRWTWSSIVAAAWVMVAVVLFSRMALQHALLARLLRRCAPVVDEEWACSAAEAARRLGLVRPVRLVTHAAAKTPATAGAWRPTILLPSDADRWTASQRQLVLLHELAHVKRFDVLWQFVAGAACAIHWFNPLAWYGLSQLRRLRELACDDLVLDGQQPPTDYAETMLQVARAYQPLRLAGTIGMARGANVERRILAILDSARNRLPLTRRGATALAVVATTLILGVGSVRLENKSAVAEEAPSGDAADGPAEAAQDPEERVIEVLISDEAGAPLRDAKIYFSLCYRFGEKHDCPHGAITADGEGRAAVEIPTGTTQLKLWASQRGYVPEFANFPEEAIEGGDKLPSHYEFQLARGTKLSGQIVDEAGQPIAGAQVEVSVEVRAPDWSANPESMISDWLTDADFNSPAPITDADGRWSIDNAPAQTGETDYEFRLRISHEDYYREENWGEFQREQGVTTTMLRDGTATIVLKGGVVVEGIVVDDAGEPVTKGWVVWHDEPYFTQGDWESGLDSDGRFRTLPLASGEHPIIIVAPGYAAERRMVSVEPGLEVLLFSLKPGRRLSIRFVDADGAPVPQAGVYLGASSGPNTWNNSNALHNQSGSGVPEYGIPRRADDDGLYVWDWAPKGAVMYNVGAKGFAPQTLSLIPKSTPHVVTLAEERAATGMVTDAETGEPIAKFSAMPVIVFRQDFYSTRSVNAILGRDGHYDVPLRGSGDPNCRYRVRFEAEGYRSLVSEESFGPLDGKATLDVALEPAPARSGQVVDAEGQPVENAVVLEASPTDVPQTSNNEPDSFGSRPIRTDAQGGFALNATSESVLVRAVHDRGFVEVRLEPDEPIGTLRLQPWARVDGRLMQDGSPVGNQTIYFFPALKGNLGEPRFQDSYYAQTDPEGRFLFDHLPPIVGSLRPYLGPWEESPLTSAESAPLDLKPGKRRTVVLGGDGAVVTGRVVPTGRGDVPLDAHWSLNYLVARDRGEPLPANFPTLLFAPSEDQPIELSWLDDPNYNEWQATRSHYFVKLDPDGKLRVCGAPAGAYDLVVQLYEQPAGCLVQTVGRQIVPVEVTDADVAAGEKTIGEIEVPCRVGPRVGENMQAYKVIDADGREQMILEMQGRFVLLHVWASWCAPCLEAFPDMKAAVGELADKPIVFAGLNVDADPDQAKALAETNGWTWGQTYLGIDSDMARQLAVSSVPAYYLIGPDGKLVASSNEWQEIKATLEASLNDR